MLLHQLDQTEDPTSPWLPCQHGWCTHLSDRLSATIINAHGAEGTYFRDRGGFVLSPHHARIRCSHQSDMGSMDPRWSESGGCNSWACSRASPHTCSWASDQLQEMLEMQRHGYNECVLDTSGWHAPDIIEAWFVMSTSDKWTERAWLAFRSAHADSIPLQDFPLLMLDISKPTHTPFSVYRQGDKHE